MHNIERGSLPSLDPRNLILIILCTTGTPGKVFALRQLWTFSLERRFLANKRMNRFLSLQVVVMQVFLKAHDPLCDLSFEMGWRLEVCLTNSNGKSHLTPVTLVFIMMCRNTKLFNISKLLNTLDLLISTVLPWFSDA